MSGTTVPTPRAVEAPRAIGVGRSGRTDSTLKRALIHATLFIAALIAAFPVVRVFGVALRPNLLRRVVSLEEERRNRARLAE